MKKIWVVGIWSFETGRCWHHFYFSSHKKVIEFTSKPEFKEWLCKNKSTERINSETINDLGGLL